MEDALQYEATLCGRRIRVRSVGDRGARDEVLIEWDRHFDAGGERRPDANQSGSFAGPAADDRELEAHMRDVAVRLGTGLKLYEQTGPSRGVVTTPFTLPVSDAQFEKALEQLQASMPS